MQRYKGAILLLTTLSIAIWAIDSTSQSQKTGPQLSKKHIQIDKSKWPIADYDAPQPAEADISSKRRSRGKKYNGSKFEINPSGVSDESYLTHGATGPLPAIPTAQSDTVVDGTVTEARAYLSDDKTGVYSEFTVNVSDVIKNSPDVPVTQGSSITVQREGGRVRFPSGRTHVYSVSGEQMPSVGQRYVFFLRHSDEEKLFGLLTGYVIQDGKVSPLDEHRQFKAHEGVSEAAFLKAVREAATNSP